MATFNTIANDTAAPTAKLQNIHISESELPLSSPSEDLHSKLTVTLLPQLSEKASINYPSDDDFKPNTTRWSDTTYTSPTAVVNVASESDICTTVRVSCPSSHSIPN
jgi:hypothetical protein